MGLRGPLPNPPAIPAPRFAALAPERPRGLSAKTRRVWQAYVDQLTAAGIWRPTDEFSLLRLCRDMSELETLQIGERQVARERARPERERKARLREIRLEVKRLAAEGNPLDKIDELRAEERQLEAIRAEGNPEILLAMTQDGRRGSGKINVIASRIQREEAQFRRRLDAAAASGEGYMGAMNATTSQQPASVEALIQ